MRRNLGAITIGALLIVFGIGWLGNAFDLWQFSIFDGWWTLLLILPGTAMLFCKGQRNTGALLLALELCSFGRIGLDSWTVHMAHPCFLWLNLCRRRHHLSCCYPEKQ